MFFSFLGGDLKFISEWFGLQGGRAKYRCIWCFWEAVQIRGNAIGDENYEREWPARTLASIVEDAALKQTRTKRTGTIESTYSHSVKGVPVGNVDMDHVAPPPFHMVHGLGNAILDLCEKRISAEDLTK
jgi:hypothetical protein